MRTKYVDNLDALRELAAAYQDGSLRAIWVSKDRRIEARDGHGCLKHVAALK